MSDSAPIPLPTQADRQRNPAADLAIIQRWHDEQDGSKMSIREVALWATDVLPAYIRLLAEERTWRTFFEEYDTELRAELRKRRVHIPPKTFAHGDVAVREIDRLNAALAQVYREAMAAGQIRPATLAFQALRVLPGETCDHDNQGSDMQGG